MGVVWFALLGLSGCLTATDVYDQRRDELQHGGDDSGPQEPGILVRVVDASGLPIDGVPVIVNGSSTPTDAAGLAWIGVEETAVASVDGLLLAPSAAAPTGAAVTPVDGYTGATLELVPLQTLELADGVGAINDAGRRSIAFPVGTFDAPGDVLVTFAWADGHAPPSDRLDVFRAVYLGVPTGAGWIGPATWRENARASDPLRAVPGLALYRFDLQTASWILEGPVAFPDTTWLEAELGAPGAWFALAAPVSTAACPEVAATDLETGAALPGIELRILRSDRDAPGRVVADADGVACLAGQAGPITLGALRGVAGGSPRAWFDPGTATAAVSGQRIELRLHSAIDEDRDGLLAAEGWDCDDGDPAVRPGAADPEGDYVDANCDGLDGLDRDGDGDLDRLDCEPDFAGSADGLAEVCDGRDNDCDGVKDDGDMPATLGEGSSCRRCEAQAIADLRPILYFPLDDVDLERGAADHSGWGRDLHVAGGFSSSWPGIADWTTDVPYWPGDLGDFLWLEDSDQIWPQGDLTLSVWVRPEFMNRVVLSYQSERSDPNLYEAEGCDPLERRVQDFSLQLQLTQTFLQVADASAKFTSPDAQLPVRQWSHVVMVVDRGVPSLYVDGELVLPVGVPVSFSCKSSSNLDLPVLPVDMHPGGVLRVGQSMSAWPASGEDGDEGDMSGLKAWEGVLDELVLFDRPLEAWEVGLLFGVTTCGEELTCDQVDDDRDGTTDEHLLGTPDCPAEGAAACADILDSASLMGVGPYTIDLGDGPLDVWCTDDGRVEYCGDGARSDLIELAALESCDEAGDPTDFPADAESCDACVAELPMFTDCQEVLDADPSARDGAYRLDLDGSGPHPPVTVRCDMEGKEAWTEVFRHDAAAGVLFNDPRDPTGICPSTEICDNGVEEGADGLMDCADPQCFTAPNCAATTGVLPENQLCPDPRDGVPDAYCQCACPARVKTGDNTACLGPLGTKFSLVGWLDAFQDTSSYVQYRLTWPFHAATGAVQWYQDWLPTVAPATRADGWCFDPKQLPTGDSGKGFAGLAAHGPDPECHGFTGAETTIYNAFDGIDEQSPSDLGCSHLFTVGLVRGSEFEDGYGIPSNWAHGGDHSSKSVELWVRRTHETDPCAP